MHRPNLTVLTAAHVTRVCIEGGRAVGVAWLAGGQAHAARADSEVLLAAGALQSPQLLQLSGIGPADALRRHGIAVQVDAPEVGANLQDHYQARVIVKLREKSGSLRAREGRHGLSSGGHLPHGQ